MRIYGIKRTFILMTLLVSMIGAGFFVAVPKAEAAVSYMPISGVTVCRSQGHFGGSYGWYWNPNSWYCYDLSIPAGITFASGPNFTKYCKARGFTAAEAWPRNAMSWRCYKL